MYDNCNFVCWLPRITWTSDRRPANLAACVRLPDLTGLGASVGIARATALRWKSVGADWEPDRAEEQLGAKREIVHNRDVALRKIQSLRAQRTRGWCSGLVDTKEGGASPCRSSPNTRRSGAGLQRSSSALGL